MKYTITFLSFTAGLFWATISQNTVDGRTHGATLAVAGFLGCAVAVAVVLYK
jgi:hypothetical protein